MELCKADPQWNFLPMLVRWVFCEACTAMTQGIAVFSNLGTEERLISNYGFIKGASFTKATGRSQWNPFNQYEVPMIILPKFGRGDVLPG